VSTGTAASTPGASAAHLSRAAMASREGKDAEFSDFSGDEESSASNSMVNNDEDDDSDFDASFADSEPGAKRGKATEGDASLRVKEVENQPYDAKVDLDESFSDESIDTNEEEAAEPKMRQLDTSTKPSARKSDRGDSPPRNLTSPGLGKGDLSETEEIPGIRTNKRNDSETEESSDDDEDDDGGDDDDERRKSSIAGVKLEAQSEYMQQAARRAAEQSQARKNRDAEEEDDDDDEESTVSSGAPGKARSTLVGGYDASDYQHLDVTSEVREMFQYIGRYKPHELELDTKLKCFIPDFIPAVGQIDTFVKIPHPNPEVRDELGLRVLDEPSANQSDVTVLDLQLRAISKKSVKNPMVVRSIENANRDKKAVKGWIESIKELHRSKPMPTVHYTRQMPDIDSLMQVWPEEVEALMREIKLPSADMDLDLKDFARVVCAILDIPVFSSMTESLHVLFTLYMEFKNNQHFQRTNQEGAQAQLQENYYSNE